MTVLGLENVHGRGEPKQMTVPGLENVLKHGDTQVPPCRLVRQEAKFGSE